MVGWAPARNVLSGQSPTTAAPLRSALDRCALAETAMFHSWMSSSLTRAGSAHERAWVSAGASPLLIGWSWDRSREHRRCGPPVPAAGRRVARLRRGDEDEATERIEGDRPVGRASAGGNPGHGQLGRDGRNGPSADMWMMPPNDVCCARGQGRDEGTRDGRRRGRPSPRRRRCHRPTTSRLPECASDSTEVRRAPG